MATKKEGEARLLPEDTPGTREGADCHHPCFRPPDLTRNLRSGDAQPLKVIAMSGQRSEGCHRDAFHAGLQLPDRRQVYGNSHTEPDLNMICQRLPF
jgi:hypothetical protein